MLAATFVAEYYGANYFNTNRSTAIMGWAPFLLMTSFVSACMSFRGFDPKKGMKIRLFILVLIGFEVLVYLWLSLISLETLI
jgi:hypothetical protein